MIPAPAVSERVNWQKASILLVTIICLTVLLVTSTISEGVAAPIFTLIIGYVVGNGVGAKTGSGQAPLIQPQGTPGQSA